MARRTDGPFKVTISGKLLDALDGVAGELEARDDLLVPLTDTDIVRHLLAHAIEEHNAGRGPWPRK